MTENNISDFMLERYRLGELDPADEGAITRILMDGGADGSCLKSRLNNLEESDRELRLQYPLEYFNFNSSNKIKSLRPAFSRRINVKFNAKIARIAAVAAVCIMLPVIYFLQKDAENPIGQAAGTEGFMDITGDRVKGLAQTEPELSIYLKNDWEIPLPGKTSLPEGSTVQLAYATPPGEHYGVIFSIDGRSIVTMHYPYRQGQSSLLDSGKRTFLNEAYTLDDAPDYEIFVLVVSKDPLDSGTILSEAGKIAEELRAEKHSDYKTIEDKNKAAFDEYYVETLIILKI